MNRYRHREELDGLPPGEGAFLLCSFWMVQTLALMGRKDEATARFEKLLALRNDVGLLSEEYDTTAQRFLGNIPQAFSHTALINSALQLSAPAHDAPFGRARAGWYPASATLTVTPGGTISSMRSTTSLVSRTSAPASTSGAVATFGARRTRSSERVTPTRTAGVPFVPVAVGRDSDRSAPYREPVRGEVVAVVGGADLLVQVLPVRAAEQAAQSSRDRRSFVVSDIEFESRRTVGSGQRRGFTVSERAAMIATLALVGAQIARFAAPDTRVELWKKIFNTGTGSAVGQLLLLAGVAGCVLLAIGLYRSGVVRHAAAVLIGIGGTTTMITTGGPVRLVLIAAAALTLAGFTWVLATVRAEGLA